MVVEHQCIELLIEGWREVRDASWQEGWDLSARTFEMQLELNDLTTQVVEEYGD